MRARRFRGLIAEDGGFDTSVGREYHSLVRRGDDPEPESLFLDEVA